MIDNPLLRRMHYVESRLDAYKREARRFYHEVVLSGVACPVCERRMFMTGASRARCTECGLEVDPTEEFQRSRCCGARLSLRRSHYACVRCGRTISSKFLFDERVFNAEYFRERMAESRERKQQRREEIRLMLLGTRSNSLVMADFPEAGVIGDMVQALDAAVQADATAELQDFLAPEEFCMETYRLHIRERLRGCMARFSSFPPIAEDARLDKIRRFVTLIFHGTRGRSLPGESGQRNCGDTVWG